MKSVLILGGDLINKGAQAMTYITVNEIRKRYPGTNVTLLSYKDAIRKDLDRDNLLFDIESMTFQDVLYHLGGCYSLLSRLVSLKKHSKPNRALSTLLSSSECMVNISGFALSSKWGFNGSMFYLLSILLMKKYDVKVVLMPQSFGPFSFRGIKKIVFDWYAKKALSYPKHIFAREQEGFDYLVQGFGLTNVSLSPDLVLQNKSSDYDLVLKKKDILIPSVPCNSVAIIPNVRSMENAQTKLIEIYTKIVQYYLERNIPVTILAHSNEDILICKQIREPFLADSKVVYLDQELACYEYESLVRRFRYVLAARFHSIVHAYKEGVPCIAFGWAIKYQELMKLFSQEQYAIDVSKINNVADIIYLINNMESNLEINRGLIRQGLSKVQQENCFSILEGISE